MSDSGEALGDLISRKTQEAQERYRIDRSLRVAVLGPGPTDGEAPGPQKRRDIRGALAADGHRPFFLEERVDPAEPRESLLEQERRILSDSAVDLVIVLHTQDSFGALMEIANFASEPAIKAKTAVLFPLQFYTPESGLPGNTIREYRDKMIYSDEHFQSCQIVGECRKWAHDRATGQWPDPIPHSF